MRGLRDSKDKQWIDLIAWLLTKNVTPGEVYEAVRAYLDRSSDRARERVS